MKPGVKRLAVVLGCAGAVAHLVMVFVFVPDFEQSLGIYLRIGVITAVCFLIPFGLVYGTAWTIQGFRQQSTAGDQRPPHSERLYRGR
jgi:hypothetical protein